MELLTNTWIIGLITFFIGIGIGVILMAMFRSDEVRSRKLEEEIDQLQHDFDIYKETVGRHFGKTSELFNNLTEDYVKVYRHLSEGADKLADKGPISPQLNQESKLVEIINDSEADDSTPSFVEPPKDYAPKPEDEEGTLSEAYSASGQKSSASS